MNDNLKKGQDRLKEMQRSRKEVVEEKSIITSTLQDYTKKVIEAAKEGFETNELNRFYARSSIGVYSITLVKYAPEKEIVKLEDKPAVQELLAKIGAEADEQVGAAIPTEAPKVKRGPKPKVTE